MKIIFITGSTDGIGKLAALKFSKNNHKLLLHGRSLEKLKNTISEIKDQTKNENITGFVSDLSDFKSVENMITEVSAKFPQIDVLINNAGVFKSDNQFNEEGLDLRFAVNYLAPYIVTSRLIPSLKKSAEPRIINLSSAAQSPVEIDALSGKKSISNQEAYAQSKLALTMWSFVLSETFTDIITIAVNPGSLLNTRMANEAYGQHWSPATKGSDILYDLALSEEYKNSSGKYFDNDKGSLKGTFAKAHSDAYNERKISTLIMETNKILKK